MPEHLSPNETPHAGAESEGSAMTARYVVIENTPGYMPEDDDPATFDDETSAREYLRERVEDYCEYVMEGYSFKGREPVVTWHDPTSAYVYDPQREHDLGRVFEIIESEDEL